MKGSRSMMQINKDTQVVANGILNAWQYGGGSETDAARAVAKQYGIELTKDLFYNALDYADLLRHQSVPKTVKQATKQTQSEQEKPMQEKVPVTDLVVVKEGKPVTTSLKIAEVFGKLHKNVIRDIEALDCPPEFAKLNFERCSYDDRGRAMPMYELTRKGFVFLTMGFTGKKAAKFKISYIDEFDRMEEALRSQQQQPQPQTMPDLDDPATLKGLLLDNLNKVIEMTPKAQAYDQFISSEGLFNLSDIAKQNKVSPHKMKPFLQLIGVLQQKGNGRLPYQQHVDEGRCVVKTVYSASSNWSGPMCFFTPTGVDYIAEKVRKMRGGQA